MPEYTLTLLIWVVPLLSMIIVLRSRKALKPLQRKAMAINLVILSGVGFFLDLAFANRFFTFPNPSQTIGITVCGIPIEEFLFYLLGFWFIIVFYVFNDELFLRRYNRDDREYNRFARRTHRSWYLTLTVRSFMTLGGLSTVFIVTKHFLNPGPAIPGYILYLAAFAYVPYVLFWRLSKRFVNVQALILTITVTTLISIIWEVTLALPRGYWNYRHEFMVGIYIPFWDDLPIEAVTVWVFSSLIVISYEYTKLLLHRREQHRPGTPSSSSATRLKMQSCQRLTSAHR